MTDRRRGLGRGLGALIPSARTNDAAPPGRAPEAYGSDDGGRDEGVDAVDPAGTDELAPHPDSGEDLDGLVDGGARFAELTPSHITTNSRQPRQVFDEDAHEELVRSVREVGVLQPVVVRRLPGPGEARYELVMGERRWRAAQAVGLATIPAIIRQTGDDVMLRDALLENLHRAQLNPLEEAAAYDQLLQDFGCTQEELSERIGRSRPQISNTIRLLKLPPSVQRRLAAGVLSAGHARALLGLTDAAGQERLAQRIVAEGLSVRTVEEIVAVGEAPSGQRQPRTRRPVAPALADLAARLSGRFETRVKVDLGKRRGRISVEFGSIDDLERIVEMMDPSGSAGLSADDEQRAAGPQIDRVDRPAAPEASSTSESPFSGGAAGASEGQDEAGRRADVGPANDQVNAGFSDPGAVPAEPSIGSTSA